MALNQVGLERLNTATTKKIGTNKNLIINGAMQVAQRGTSKTNVQDEYATVDRFRTNGTTGTFTMSQESDAPAGFAKSLKMLATADISAAAGNLKEVYYSFEGQDLQQLEKGTSTAKKVTLSFYVKSNVTGLKTAYLLDKDNTRLISKDYTINVSATWERKTITFDGDTTGALDNDNARSFDVHFPIVAGSTYTGGTQSTAWGADTVNERVNSSITQIDTTNEYWQITGIQLEVGSVATDFEHRSFGQELALCQRYFQQIGASGQDGTYVINGGYLFGNGAFIATGYTMPVMMRATPTIANGSTKLFCKSDGVQTNIDTYNFIEFVYPSTHISISGQLASDAGDDNELCVWANPTNGLATLDSEL